MIKRLSAILSITLAGMIALAACNNNKSTNVKVQDSHSTPKPITDITPPSDPSKNPKAALDRKDTIVVGTSELKGIFNPIYFSSEYDSYVVGVIFDSLNDISKDGTPAPWICDLPTITDDGKKYTYKMKQDVKFSDGTPMTMKDVEFTFTLMADATYTGPAEINKYNIVGWNDYKNGKVSEIEGIKVIDDKTIEFTLEEANASAAYFFGGTGILSKDYYGKNYRQGNAKAIEELNLKPMGSGPYIIKEYKKGQEVDLTANKNYFMGIPKIPNLVYKVTSSKNQIAGLKSGEIDIDTLMVNNSTINDVKSAGFLELQIFPNNGFGYIAFNMKDQKYSDSKVRQALVYGLDRAGIANEIYGQYAVVPDIPQSQTSWAYTDKIIKYSFDQEKAGQLLDEAGWKLENGKRIKDGKNLKITFSPIEDNDGPFNDALISKVKDNWGALGIEVVIDKIGFNSLIDRVDKGDFDTFFMAWKLTDDPDPTNIFATTGVQNRNLYSNRIVDDLCRKGLKETDLAKRRSIYEQLYQEINKDLPYVFLYQRKNMVVVNSRVKGIEATTYRNLFQDLYKAELSDK